MQSTTATSDTPSFNLDGIGEDPATDSKLLVVDSLFSVLRHLPGLTLEKNSGYYFVQGIIEPSDLGLLYDYARCVGMLTLGADPLEYCLAPQVFTRIARLQDRNELLFPFLHHLRVVANSSSLNSLDLLLSSSLMTLEMVAIPISDPCYPSVLSFFECSIYQSPNLSTLILGPGLFEDQILNTFSRFKNLRCLKLLDVGISITDQLLQDIGSLQYLETFVLRDNGGSTRPPATLEPEQPLVDSPLFSALQAFEVGGAFDLIEDLVAKVSSSNLRVLSIDITKLTERKSSRKKRKVGTLSGPMLLIQESIRKGPNTLVSVSLKNTSTTSLQFPLEVFDELLSRPIMKHLEITGMGESSDYIPNLGVGNSKLEVLRLPVHSTAPVVYSAGLRHIAEACPHLKSLCCRLLIRQPSDIILPSSPLSHPLEVLSVSHDPLQQSLSVGIARYLDSIFPRLKSIEAYDGKDIQQWSFILELVKSYQAVRMAEYRRLGLEPDGCIKI